MPKYFPLFLDLQDKPCLVVGAGEIATRKAAQLLHYGARLTVVAPEASGTVREWAQEGRVHWHQREFRDSDVEGMLLVVASTDNSQVNRAIFDAASGRGILCLLYTSDAADDLLCVDLGGRRINKKKHTVISPTRISSTLDIRLINYEIRRCNKPVIPCKY